ncbi:MAG: hypothetical protein NTU64_14345, partial [Hyphomicrobiales bacterium]|nr:hypothetical protein [Hyphomicrobiales bacterium]
GGMNPVFAEKLTTQEGYDNKGRLIHVATAPGALPRTPDAPAPTQIVSVPKPVAEPDSAPVVLANVPVPRPVNKPDAVKPTGTALVRSAAASTTKARDADVKPEPASPKAVAVAAQPVKQRSANAASKPDVTDDAPRAESPPQLRTAFSAPPASTGALLTGAQPVVPTGTFDSRWSGSGFR